MKTVVVILVGACLLALVACGGDDDDDAATVDETSDDGGSESSEPESSEPESGDGESSEPESGDGESSEPESGDGESSEPESGDGQPAAPSGDAGSLTLGEETIVFESSRCFLEEQEAAAGGGSIELTGQAFGTNAAGEQVAVDFTRYSEESQFAGDDVTVDIGDPFSDDAVGLTSSDLPAGTVQLDGNVLSAEGITLVNFDDFSEVVVSFQINC